MIDMTLSAILERVECGLITIDDAAQLRRWLQPDLQWQIVKSQFVLMCNAEAAREFIAPDLRQGLAAELTRDLSNETTT